MLFGLEAHGEILTSPGLLLLSPFRLIIFIIIVACTRLGR